MLNLEIARIDIEDKKIVLKVPEYYLNMDPETIAYYCFYAKNQNDTKLNREYVNIYYNKNQPKPKSNLKLTGRTFFSAASQSVRSRTYSDNASSGLPTLEIGTRGQLKNSESTDKLTINLEEQKSLELEPESHQDCQGAPTPETDEMKVRKAQAKSIIDKPQDIGFIEVPKSKRNQPKKPKKNKRRNKKGKDFHNWTYVNK